MTKRLLAAAALACLLAAPLLAQTVTLRAGQKVREAQVLCGQDGKNGLLFYGQNSWQALWLDQKALQTIQSAAAEYQDRFQRRKLKKSGQGVLVRLGPSAQAFLEWGSAKDSLNRSAPAKVRAGYVFEANSPYFCLEIPPVKNKAPSQSPALQESEKTRLLLTRAQLQAFLSHVREGNE